MTSRVTCSKDNKIIWCAGSGWKVEPGRRGVHQHKLCQRTPKGVMCPTFALPASYGWLQANTTATALYRAVVRGFIETSKLILYIETACENRVLQLRCRTIY